MTQEGGWWSPFTSPVKGMQSDEASYMDAYYPTNTADKLVERSQEMTELYNLIKNRKWREAGERARAVPKEALIWITETDERGNILLRQLVIHKACEVHPPEKLIDILISAHPRGVQLKNSNGDLPLHIACSECASGVVINKLIYHFPDGTCVKNEEGKLPLHLACRQWNDVQLIKNLLVAYNQGAQCADSDGLLPLHCACSQNVDPDVVERLLYAFPEASTMKDRWGRTPLAIAMTAKGKNTDRIIHLLRRDISFWRVSIVDQVHVLKEKLNKTSVSEREYSHRASGLEEELMNITSRSNEAARKFREMKGSLEEENNHLKNRLQEVTKQLEERENKIGKLIVENMNYKNNLQDIQGKYNNLTKLFPTMEEYRREISTIANKWEDCLREAKSHTQAPVDMSASQRNRSTSTEQRDEDGYQKY